MINIAEIFSTHRNRLLKFILGRVKTAEDAQDILQEIFLRLIVNNEQNDISHVSAWLYRTARNHIIDRSRKQAGSTPHKSLQDDVNEITDTLIDNDCDQEKDIIRNLVWARLYEALEDLPEEQQQVFVETEMNGTPYKELSARTGVSVKTLLSRKHYAVMHLRSCLKEIYEDLLTEY